MEVPERFLYCFRMDGRRVSSMKPSENWQVKSPHFLKEKGARLGIQCRSGPSKFLK